MRWGHRTTLKEQIQEPGGRLGWWVGRLVKRILEPTLALIRAQLGFRKQVLAECCKIAVLCLPT